MFRIFNCGSRGVNLNISRERTLFLCVETFAGLNNKAGRGEMDEIVARLREVENLSLV
jgi:hypothetical protein